MCQWDPLMARSSPSLLSSPCGRPAVAVACFWCESLRGPTSRTSAGASSFKLVSDPDVPSLPLTSVCWLRQPTRLGFTDVSQTCESVGLHVVMLVSLEMPCLSRQPSRAGADHLAVALRSQLTNCNTSGGRGCDISWGPSCVSDRASDTQPHITLNHLGR